MNEYKAVVATIATDYGDVRWDIKKIYANDYEIDVRGNLHFYGSYHVRIRSFSEASWVEVRFAGTQKEEIGE